MKTRNGKIPFAPVVRFIVMLMILSGLLAAIRAVRDDGGAVLWLMHGAAPVMDRSLPATQRWRMIGSRLVAVAERSA